jgi:uncharacterized membrane protein YheB (UPF0754 family)
MLLKLCFSTLICAFIGWITNFIAIKMLFHPAARCSSAA